ncbi:MAG: hypothetical protein ACOYBY_08820 [Dermatophilaceae bacterium]
MSTDPTANPPEDAPSSRPSDPTQPTFGSPPTQPTPPTAPPPASPPPAPPPPPPAYQSQPGQPYAPYGPQGSSPYPPSAPPPYQSGMYAGGLEHPQGTMILVLGILSIVLCQILGPIAWVMGRRALTEIDASGRSYTNRTMVNAGMICGIVGTVFLALGLVWLVFVIIVAIGTASTGVR